MHLSRQAYTKHSVVLAHAPGSDRQGSACSAAAENPRTGSLIEVSPISETTVRIPG